MPCRLPAIAQFPLRPAMPPLDWDWLGDSFTRYIDEPSHGVRYTDPAGHVAFTAFLEGTHYRSPHPTTNLFHGGNHIHGRAAHSPVVVAVFSGGGGMREMRQRMRSRAAHWTIAGAGCLDAAADVGVGAGVIDWCVGAAATVVGVGRMSGMETRPTMQECANHRSGGSSKWQDLRTCSSGYLHASHTRSDVCRCANGDE
jgi:hypothetical protein